ncbi:MAG: FAD-binding oxidoreductase [Promethearchaeota archaeon]|nr:MAG: FAD-binding oxidoreductase [Candidatus Lokiarchaeota archaeon]
MNNEILDQLKKIVGEDNISIDPVELSKYSRDFNNFGTNPDFIVTCHNKEQLKNVLLLANEYIVPVTPRSSKIDYYGASIPTYGGILLNLQEMKNIKKIDTSTNRYATIEPGVTFEELQSELDKEGFQVMMPIGVSCKNSILSTYLERTPLLSGPIPILSNGWQCIFDMDVLLPNGDNFNTGSGEATPQYKNLTPHGVTGPDFSRIFTAAQGTMGIVTEMSIKIKRKHPFESIFAVISDKLNLLETAVKLKKLDIGRECLLINQLNFAAMLSENYNELDELFEILPKWVMILRIVGYDEDELKVNLEDLNDFKLNNSIDTLQILTEKTGLEDLFLKEFKLPNKLINFRYYKGHCKTLSFYTEFDKIDELDRQIEYLAGAYDYPVSDLYGYIMPIEQARTFYCEYNFHSDPEDLEYFHSTQQLYQEACDLVLNLGGVIDRPYGQYLVNLIYSKSSSYYDNLLMIKSWFDPNNILNPGKIFP